MLRDFLWRLRDLPRYHGRALAITGGGLAVVAVAVVVLLMTLGGGGVPAGYTKTPTVKPVASNVARPAQPRPAVAPPKIYATGACKTTLDGVRAVMDRYPSGLVLGQKGASELNASLAKLNDTRQAPCDAKTVEAFNVQELDPWMNYLVPATAAPAAPTAKVPAASSAAPSASHAGSAGPASTPAAKSSAHK